MVESISIRAAQSLTSPKVSLDDPSGGERGQACSGLILTFCRTFYRDLEHLEISAFDKRKDSFIAMAGDSLWKAEPVYLLV